MKSREAAERNADAAQVRFDNGMLTNFEVVQNQSQLTAARLGELAVSSATSTPLPSSSASRKSAASRSRSAHVFPGAGAPATPVSRVCPARIVHAKDSSDSRRRHPRRRRGVVLPLERRRHGRRIRRGQRGRSRTRRRAAGRGAGGRTLMTVEPAPVTRHEVVDYITVVGNLIGEATVDVVPRVAGRIDRIPVKLGDRVAQRPAGRQDRGPRDPRADQPGAGHARREQGERRRSARTKCSCSRTRSSARRPASSSGLTARQILEDAEARYNAAVSQLNVAKAQQSQTQSRIDELKITLSNTSVSRPSTASSAGASSIWARSRTRTPRSSRSLTSARCGSSPISSRRASRRSTPGVEAKVQVDTFSWRGLLGRVSRVAPVFDPATRTAQMEIEVPNPGFRLKPGMYARVRLTVERRPNALTVPRNAVVDVDGKRGVFLVEGPGRQVHGSQDRPDRRRAHRDSRRV